MSSRGSEQARVATGWPGRASVDSAEATGWPRGDVAPPVLERPAGAEQLGDPAPASADRVDVRPDVAQGGAGSEARRARLRSWHVDDWGPRLPALVLVLAALVPQLTWWRGRSVVWGTDGALPLRLSELSHYFSITAATPGAPDARKLCFLYPWGLVLAGWDKIGLPWNASVAQHLLVFGLMAASGLGALAWARRLLPRLSLTSATVAALFYMFNPFALITVWSSQSNLMFHYSFLPLLGLSVMRLGERPGWRAASGVAVLWSVLMTPAYITTPLVVTDVALVTLLLLRAVFLAPGGRARGKVLVSAAVLGCGFLVLNAFWIWPLHSYYGTEVVRGAASANNESIDLYALNSTPLPDALRLNGYWGLTTGVQGSPNFPWAAYYYRSWASVFAYVPMLLAASGLVFYPLSRRLRGTTRVERASLVFAGASVWLLVVAVTGARAPFGTLNTHLMTSLHLLDVFRSVYARFTEYLPLVMAPLLAAGLDALSSAVGGSRRGAGRGPAVRRAAAVSCSGALAGLIVLVVPWPMWSGALFDGTGPLPPQRFTVPPSATTAAKLIDAQEGEFAVAVLPMGPSALTYLSWPRGGFTGIQPYSFLTGKAVILGDAGSPAARRLSSVLTDDPEDACSTLNSLNARDVVVDPSPNLSVVSWKGALGADTEATRRALSRLPCLRLALRSAGADVYVNEMWSPRRFFAPATTGDPFETSLPYRRVAPGVYRVTLPDAGSSDRLVVNTPSDSNWRMQGGTRVSEGELTTFRYSGRAGSASVLVWNQAEVVSSLLLALAVAVTLLIAFGRRLLVLVRRAWALLRGRRSLSRPSGDQQPS